MDIDAEPKPSAPVLAVQYAARVLRAGGRVQLGDGPRRLDIIAVEAVISAAQEVSPTRFVRGSDLVLTGERLESLGVPCDRQGAYLLALTATGMAAAIDRDAYSHNSDSGYRNPQWMSGSFELGGLDVTYNRFWGVVVGDLPADRGLPVYGEPLETGEFAGRWRTVELVVDDEAVVASVDEVSGVIVACVDVMPAHARFISDHCAAPAARVAA